MNSWTITPTHSINSTLTSNFRPASAPTSVTESELILLGIRLANDGATWPEGALRRLADAAQHAGVTPAARSVLADRDAPVVARLRAFAVVAQALLATNEVSPGTSSLRRPSHAPAA